MFTTLQFNWTTYLQLITQELDKLEKMADGDAKQDYANKITDNISKMWSALCKEIRVVEYQDKRDHDTLTTLQQCLNYCDNEEDRNALKHCADFISENKERMTNFADVKHKLIALKKRWQEITKQPLTINQEFKQISIGNLEGQLLFKKASRLTKFAGDEFNEKLLSLKKVLQDKNQLWQKQLIDLQNGIITKKLSLQAAFLAKDAYYVLAYQEDIKRLQEKIRESEAVINSIQQIKLPASKNQQGLKK